MKYKYFILFAFWINGIASFCQMNIYMNECGLEINSVVTSIPFGLESMHETLGPSRKEEAQNCYHYFWNKNGIILSTPKDSLSKANLTIYISNKLLRSEQSDKRHSLRTKSNFSGTLSVMRTIFNSETSTQTIIDTGFKQSSNERYEMKLSYCLIVAVCEDEKLVRLRLESL